LDAAEHLRAEAVELIKLARLVADTDIAARIEAIAISLLKRAADLEKDAGF
jgi:hypothetical protein